MSKYIYIVYKDLDIASFYFTKDNMIDEDFVLENKIYHISSVLGEKGACSLVIKYKNKVLFSTIFDANRVGIPNITFFFLIGNEEYLQVGYSYENCSFGRGR